VTQRAIILLCLALVLAGAGCGGKRHPAPTPQVGKVTLPPPSPKYEHPDEKILEEIPPGKTDPTGGNLEVKRPDAGRGQHLQNERTLALLDIILTKSLSGAPKEIRHRLLRNLGIIHYHQKKFNLARQELQQANELFPRDARTHFYLARLAFHQGNIYQRQGLTKKAMGQFNLAAHEMEIAQKLEPSNDTYRQELRKVLQNELTPVSNPKE
jgi:tetratricopeptide (TPR) repeat protein